MDEQFFSKSSDWHIKDRVEYHIEMAKDLAEIQESVNDRVAVCVHLIYASIGENELIRRGYSLAKYALIF